MSELEAPQKTADAAFEVPDASLDSEIPNASQIPGLRTGLDIHNAIEKVYRVSPIGFCPLVDQRHDETIEYETASGYIDTKSGKKRSRDISEKDNRLVQNFATLHNRYSCVYSKGTALKSPLKLTINLPGYAFDEELIFSHYGNSDEERLKTWFEHAGVSGFGDMRDQTTKVDETVRNAKEITSDSFSVTPELLLEIQHIWQKNFVPSQVRVEPYKIHLYGTGGHFQPHRDTPQKDLVGTFLVGIGDTTYSQHLVVDGNSSSAYVGTWVAFYPDVPHEVTKIKSGYRAVIAFKIFRVLEDEGKLSEDVIPLILRCSLETLVFGLEAPFGLILDRKYCLGTTKLSGIDAAILECAKSRKDISVKIVPITLSTSKFDHFIPTHGKEDNRAQIITEVRPFTTDVIDALLDRESTAKDVLEWWRRIKNVTFYDLREDGSLVKWSTSEEQINHTGNEADATREDSIYLSYSLLCLPIKAVDEENETDEEDDEDEESEDSD